MTKQQYDNYQQQAMNGTISDNKNPAFIFSLVSNELLVQIAEGKIDAKALALLTLQGRNYNMPTQQDFLKKLNEAADKTCNNEIVNVSITIEDSTINLPLTADLYDSLEAEVKEHVKK